jgi:acetyl esterase
MSYAFDPELAALVPMLTLSEGNADFSNPAEARSRMVELTASMNADLDTSGLTIGDRVIPGDVTVRVYAPTERAGPVPAVVYIHGGGFAIGSVETEHAGAAGIAAGVGAVVVSVEYRLAPEHPFPAPLDDCYAALVWVHSAADELGIDPDRVAVYGGSAGGGLAAGLALLARDRGGPKLCFQFLGIPELDDRLETPSMQRFVDTPMWNRPSAVNSWRHYLGDAGGEVSPYAAPARATDLSNLPPAYVSTMEFDPLRDEGIIYALRLLQAGVSVELHQYPGTFHGSALVTTASVSKRQAAEARDVLRRALRAGDGTSA